MLIEATEKPVTYRWPGGEVTITPGQPVDVPDERAEKILAKAGAKVQEFKPDWRAAWRELADISDGLEPDDERLLPVVTTMNAADAAYKAHDWNGFQRAANEVRKVMGASSSNCPI